ncbi:THAP domain-containing protein 3-like isoform X1 [Scleropages formosus]|uniref:THAP domain-containing protein 3-like isoform X1 n=2 Tax=Scleropages formosus TaxID=113540 RepID=UPI000878765D|nr:THAP domain-containing protein 3-like isoform X1 [Scleropages formosus]XP_018618938.1 THAP domain-containing protein 3-like isoform X1 [Scleropages formosus]
MRSSRGTQCYAFNCTNYRNKQSKEKGLSFHKFPNKERDKERYQMWIRNCRRDRPPGKGSVLCSKHFNGDQFDRTGQIIRLKDGAVPTLFAFPEHLQPVPMLNVPRRGDDTATEQGQSRGNGEQSNPLGPKRKRLYKEMLEDGPAGCSSAQSSQSEKVVDLENRYPPGSWEQATVEAIMKLRTLDTAATTSHVAQMIIANLKDENDFLRAQNAKLRSELKAMRTKHEAELRGAMQDDPAEDMGHVGRSPSAEAIPEDTVLAEPAGCIPVTTLSHVHQETGTDAITEEADKSEVHICTTDLDSNSSVL